MLTKHLCHWFDRGWTQDIKSVHVDYLYVDLAMLENFLELISSNDISVGER